MSNPSESGDRRPEGPGRVQTYTIPATRGNYGGNVMRVYIAGPMRGLPGWNFPAFDAAAERWRAAGHQPFSPAAVDRALAYGPAEGTEGQSAVSQAHLRHVLMMDFACLLSAEAIALLPGWEHSTGATVELAVAQFLGLPVYCAVTMEPLSPDFRPWGEIEAFLADWKASRFGAGKIEALRPLRDRLRLGGQECI